MATCRVCGTICSDRELRSVQDGGGCTQCNGSPACSRCGHARKHHRGTFGGAARKGCTAAASVADALAVGRCGCEGYTADPTAFGEQPPIVDVVELRLRGPGDPRAADAHGLAPVSDAFGHDGRLRDLSEPRGVPWRPPE